MLDRARSSSPASRSGGTPGSGRARRWPGRWLLALPLLVAAQAGWSALPLPKIVRVYPLGGQAGTSVNLEILGEYLSNASRVEFDCEDLKWVETVRSSSGKLSGAVVIAPRAPLGPHMLRAVTRDGYSTSAIFNVGQFPSVLEAEPNDLFAQAQPIPALPAEFQGRLDGAADVDRFSFRARAGERWVFDLRSIEHGSSVEARMLLTDSQGHRVAFDDDRSDYDETPLIQHTFARAGTYFIKLDQYRGPRGFNFGKNCAYTLRISTLPAILYSSPLGLRRGRTTRMRIGGAGLKSAGKVYLTELRRAEYTRMTYPFTVPVAFRPDPPTAAQVVRVEGRLLAAVPSSAGDSLQVEFRIPPDTRPGLWRLWVAGPAGVFEGPKIEVSDLDEYSEAEASQGIGSGAYAINGSLARPGEQDAFPIPGAAGRPLRFQTLAAQLGGAHLDTVLELRDASGRKLAENDDVVAGQGTLIGNPDSSLFYTPAADGPLTLIVKDRIQRGGPSFQYRLKVSGERPGFQLFTTPENFAVPRGGSGEIKVHLVREAGFEGEVSIWFEGLPPGVEAPRAKFRADQLFEPNADGADMIIPEITFRIQAPESLPPGDYPIRVLGTPAGEESRPGRRLVLAQTNLILGPLLDLWNFIRRPMPSVTMTVVEPFEARLSLDSRTITMERGGSATLELKAARVPGEATFEILDLPAGVSYRLLGRQDDQVTLQLETSAKSPLGSFDISAEAVVSGRRAPAEPITLVIQDRAAASLTTP